MIPSGAAILVYVLGSSAGIRLLKARKVLPVISLIISLVVLPFVGPLLVVSLVVAALAFVYAKYAKRGKLLGESLPPSV